MILHEEAKCEEVSTVGNKFFYEDPVSFRWSFCPDFPALDLIPFLMDPILPKPGAAADRTLFRFGIFCPNPVTWFSIRPDYSGFLAFRIPEQVARISYHRPQRLCVLRIIPAVRYRKRPGVFTITLNSGNRFPRRLYDLDSSTCQGTKTRSRRTQVPSDSCRSEQGMETSMRGVEWRRTPRSKNLKMRRLGSLDFDGKQMI